LADALSRIDSIEFALPDGGMYLLLRLPEGMDDFQIAKRLVQEAGLGLAPGSAFAPEAQGWLRWCFASKELDRLRAGAERLDRWLSKL
jgi:aspartate/methionine/tyrosine aminotransferase